MRRCSRPGCTASAVAAFDFDGLRRILWIAPMADSTAFSAGTLCRRHADRLVAPRNWELRDTRQRPELVLDRPFLDIFHLHCVERAAERVLEKFAERGRSRVA